MVERVARGSILAPAAAAIGAAALGMMKPLPATAGQETTLQMRVQVVEACQIRLAPEGGFGEICGWSGTPPPMPSIDPRDFGSMPPPRDRPMPPWPEVTTSPPTFPAMRFDEANRRALGLAQKIAERVRYVTLTF